MDNILLTDSQVFRKKDAELYQAVAFGPISEAALPACDLFINPDFLISLIGRPQWWCEDDDFPDDTWDAQACWLLIDEQGGILCLWRKQPEREGEQPTAYGYRCTSDDLISWLILSTLSKPECFDRSDLEPGTEQDIPRQPAHESNSHALCTLDAGNLLRVYATRYRTKGSTN